MIHSIPNAPDPRRYEAHAQLFTSLSKLGTLLSMLQNEGFARFRAMGETQQAEYLGACSELALDAQKALAVWDGVAGS